MGRGSSTARYNRDELVRRIQKISRFRNRITLTCLDALVFLLPWCDTSAPRGLVYLDPPYYIKGGDLYRNHYGPEDHADVARLVQHLRTPWLVSYDAVPPIFALYQGDEHVRYSLAYSAGTRIRGSEVMFFSEGLRVPEVRSPAGVPFAMVDGQVPAIF